MLKGGSGAGSGGPGWTRQEHLQVGSEAHLSWWSRDLLLWQGMGHLGLGQTRGVRIPAPPAAALAPTMSSPGTQAPSLLLSLTHLSPTGTSAVTRDQNFCPKLPARPVHSWAILGVSVEGGGPWGLGFQKVGGAGSS